MKKLIATIMVLAVAVANAQESNDLIHSAGFEACDNTDAAPEGAVFWDGGGDGESWSDALNWEGDVLPAEGDDVSINIEGEDLVVIVFNIGSDVLLLNTLDSCEPIRLHGGTLELEGISRVRSSLEISNAKLITSVDLYVHGFLTQTAGSVSGAGTVQVGRQFLWSGGHQGLSGADYGTTVTYGGMVMSGAAIRNLTGRSLTLNGPSTWIDGSVFLYNGSTLNINSTLDIQADDYMRKISGAVSTLNINGSITKSAGTGISEMQFNLNNSGTVSVDSGELWLGHTDAVGTSTGDFIVSSGALLGLGGSNTLPVGSTFTGAGGLINFSGGTTVIDGGYDLGGPLDVRGGTLEFSSHENITDDIAVKTGTLRFVQGATVTGGAVLTSGILEFGAAGSIGGDIEQGNAKMVVSGDLPVGGGYAQSSGSLSGAGTVTVTGLFEWSGGHQGLTGAAHGTTVADGGMVMSGSAIRNLTGRSLTLNDLSTWADGSVFLYDGSILNANSPLDIQVDDYMRNISGAVSTFNNNSDLTKSSGTGLTTLGFNFNNTGSISVSSGAVKFEKQFAQTNVGSIVVNIGSSSHDRYEILEAATLDGVLEINLLNEFEPLLGESFEVMTFASRSAEFSTVTGADIGNGTHFEVAYGITNITLTVVSD